MTWSPQLDYRTEGGRVRGARLVTCTCMCMYVCDLGREGVNETKEKLYQVE